MSQRQYLYSSTHTHTHTHTHTDTDLEAVTGTVLSPSISEPQTLLAINESYLRVVEGHNQHLLYKLLTYDLWWVSPGNEYFIYQKYMYVNTLRTGSFKLFKRPFPAFLTILTL